MQIILKCLNFGIILYAVFVHTPRKSPSSRVTMNKYPIPEVFVLDFDGTITKKDTIDTIFKSVLPIQDEMGRDMSRAWNPAPAGPITAAISVR